MLKQLGVLFVSSLLVVSLNTAFASSKEDSPGSIDETISEILNAINDIIKGSLALAEAELKQLQRQLEKRGGALQEEAEQSILRALQNALSELKELDRAIKKNLEDMKRSRKERLNDYRKTADTLEKRVAEIKKQLEEFAQKIEKESARLRGPVEKKVRQILAEMERALDRMEQRFKKHKEIEVTLSADLNSKPYPFSWNGNVTVKT
jgi:DNA anti-recombination protein RmuC